MICSEEDFDEFEVNGMKTYREPESQKENSKSCEKLSKKTKSCETLSKKTESCKTLSKNTKSVDTSRENAKSCEKLSKEVKSCETLSKNTKSCEKLSKDGKSIEILGGHDKCDPIEVICSNEEMEGDVGDVSDDDVRHHEGTAVDESEEAAYCKVCNDPGTPSKLEKERRECMGHVQYRSWRPSCVRGRGQNSAHRVDSGKKDPRVLPEISMVLFCQGGRGEDNPTAVMIAIKDGKPKAMHAYSIPSKGACNSKVISKIAQ